MFEGDDVVLDENPPEESSNKTFIIAASVLGGIVLLSIICLAVYALVILPGQKTQQVDIQATTIAQNTQVAMMLTQTAEAQILALTPLPSATVVNTPTASPTPVVALPTETPTATPNVAATETVAAALTQAAIAIQTTIPTSSALPNGGFADDVGVPGLVTMALVLVAVVFFARRLRTAPMN